MNYRERNEKLRQERNVRFLVWAEAMCLRAIQKRIKLETVSKEEWIEYNPLNVAHFYRTSDSTRLKECFK